MVAKHIPHFSPCAVKRSLNLINIVVKKIFNISVVIFCKWVDSLAALLFESDFNKSGNDAVIFNLTLDDECNQPHACLYCECMYAQFSSVLVDLRFSKSRVLIVISKSPRYQLFVRIYVQDVQSLSEN